MKDKMRKLTASFTIWSGDVTCEKCQRLTKETDLPDFDELLPYCLLFDLFLERDSEGKPKRCETCLDSEDKNAQ